MVGWFGGWRRVGVSRGARVLALSFATEREPAEGVNRVRTIGESVLNRGIPDQGRRRISGRDIFSI